MLLLNYHWYHKSCPVSWSFLIDELFSDRVRAIPLVLIVSMMRSGTTFTGEVFRSYPDSLYLFEPMQYLSGNVGYNNITYMNGTQRYTSTRTVYLLDSRLFCIT